MVDLVIHVPRTIVDWLNLAQFSIVLICHLVLFGLYLSYAPRRPVVTTSLVLVYVLFFLISVGPVIFEATLSPTDGSPDRRLVSAIFFGVHNVLMNPIITIIACVALVPQVVEIQSHQKVGALSVSGLSAQAFVFTLVALCWLFRFELSWTDAGFVWWYRLAGWAAVNNFIFAVVQAALLLISGGSESNEFAENGETMPLIAEKV
ncbi:hypothetical protein F5B20DRAFT_119032 [Whalleya microplaca]|nr:hypothetical protein F5B20DRAFT_119032 [Whalleya microplaca]